MSRRRKLEKFAELLTFPNCYQCYDMTNIQLVGKGAVPVELKGQWHSKHFGNNHPITLELACGKGEYTIGLADRHPLRNYIGVDVKGARIWRGAKTAIEQGLDNAAFLRTRIEAIDQFFDVGEVDEIWILFPDPFLQKPNRRLTSDAFTARYFNFLPYGKSIHLKTDDDELYKFTLETIENNKALELLNHAEDIYSLSKLPHPDLDLKTYYELKHLSKGKTIKYVEFTIKSALD